MMTMLLFLLFASEQSTSLSNKCAIRPHPSLSCRATNNPNRSFVSPLPAQARTDVDFIKVIPETAVGAALSPVSLITARGVARLICAPDIADDRLRKIAIIANECMLGRIIAQVGRGSVQHVGWLRHSCEPSMMGALLRKPVWA